MIYVISNSYFRLKLFLAIKERQKKKIEFGQKRLVPESGDNCPFWVGLCLPISANIDYDYWLMYPSILMVACLENFIC